MSRHAIVGRPRRYFGVYTHARDRVLNPGGGRVVRECDAAGNAFDQRNYGGQKPWAIYATEARADKWIKDNSPA